MGLKRRSKTAGEVLSKLQADPAWVARTAKIEADRVRRTRRQAAIEKPIVDDLIANGFAVQSLDELRTSGTSYRSAIPLLLKWLDEIDDEYERESIVRTISVPWASNRAERHLIQLYRSLDDNKNAPLKWATGNAISIVVKDDTYNDELIELISDPANGKSRQMIVRGIHRFKNKSTVDALLGLLEDPVLRLAAMSSLGKIGAIRALPFLKPFVDDPDSTTRNEAKKAVNRIDRLLRDV